MFLLKSCLAYTLFIAASGSSLSYSDSVKNIPVVDARDVQESNEKVSNDVAGKLIFALSGINFEDFEETDDLAKSLTTNTSSNGCGGPDNHYGTNTICGTGNNYGTGNHYGNGNNLGSGNNFGSGNHFGNDNYLGQSTYYLSGNHFGNGNKMGSQNGFGEGNHFGNGNTFSDGRKFGSGEHHGNGEHF